MGQIKLKNNLFSLKFSLNAMPSLNKNGQYGFSLIEIAVVLVIIGLLTTGGMSIIKIKREQALYAESTVVLKQAKQALITFSVVNGHLPCPDTNDNGSENRSGNACSAKSGLVPYLDIGLTKGNLKDRWGNPVAYFIQTGATSAASVASATNGASYFNLASLPGALTFKLSTPPTTALPGSNFLTVKNGQGKVVASNQLAVLVAYDSNGLYSRHNCGALASDEKQNCNGTRTFVSTFVSTQEPSSFFDDYVVSISANELKSAILKNNPNSIQ